MTITTVTRVERTDAMLEFHLAVDHPSPKDGPPSLSVLQYLYGEARLQTPDGVRCFCVINDRNNTLDEFAVLYRLRYPHIVVNRINVEK